MVWAAILFFRLVSAFIIEVPAYKTFCVSQDLSDKVFVTVAFHSLEKLDINVRAFDQSSRLVTERYNDRNHKLGFTTSEGGQYQFCIENLNASIVPVAVDLKFGVEAKDYSIVPNTKTLSPIEILLKKIASTVETVKKELSYVREREEQLRHTTQTIGERVIGYSILTLLMLAGLSVFQIVYLRSFFRAKKIN